MVLTGLQYLTVGCRQRAVPVVAARPLRSAASGGAVAVTPGGVVAVLLLA